MTMDFDDKLKLYSQIENHERGMVLRANGRDFGSCVGWFHFGGGWCVMAPEFEPNNSFRSRFTDATVKYDNTEGNKGLVIDFYAGRLALVVHPSDGEAEGEVRVLWEGPL